MYPKQVKVVEVGMRDGLQNIYRFVPTWQKAEWIDELVACGLRQIEVSSFVNPKQVPQLADAEELFQRLELNSEINYSALVANLPGLHRALACGVKNLALFTAASETFCQANIHCSIEQSLKNFKTLIDVAKKNSKIHFRAYISCAWDCPFNGTTSAKLVMQLANELVNLGCDEIVLADTSGKAAPNKVEILLAECLNKIKQANIAVHFHNTYGFAMANTLIALQQGITRIDASIAGLGGCPSAPRTGGNVASEDLIFLLNQMGIENGVNLKRLIQLGKKLTSFLSSPNMAYIGQIKS